MTDEQDIDIFATAVYRIIQGYFDIISYHPSEEIIVFVANPMLRKRSWKWQLKKRLREINAAILIESEGGLYRLTVRKTEFKIGFPPLVNILLFILTFISVILASAVSQHGDRAIEDISLLLSGLPFAITLLVILLVHEMGHFIAGYKRGVVMSYPFFIPAPTFLGTFGAVIKGRTPIKNKNDLILIGAAGPLAGAIPALLAIIIGYIVSSITVTPAGDFVYFGDSLLTMAIRYVVIGPIPNGHTVMLSSIAQAGKVGLLVTMINLLPLGQLDGGHILYGLTGKKQHRLSILFLIFLAGMGTLWYGWWVWLVLAILIKPFHPPVIQDNIEPDRRHRIIGWTAVVLFILTFVPAPISFN
ncbi:MAG: site-2 protease family protein [Candidatus Zixiibacteriota bacterium]